MKSFFDVLINKINKYKNKYVASPNYAAVRLGLWCLLGSVRRWVKMDEKSFSQSKCFKNVALFKLYGGLGDLLISLNFLKQLHVNCKNVGFDIFLAEGKFNEEIKFILRDNVFIHKVINSKNFDENKYAFVAEFCRVPDIKKYNKKAFTSKFFIEWVNCVSDFNEKYREYLNKGTVSDYLLTKWSELQGRNRLSQANIGNVIEVKTSLCINTKNDIKILKKFRLYNKKFITFQCGTGVLSGDTLSTREWDIKNYNDLIKLIKEVFPMLVLVQIGNTSDPTMNVDLDLRGKTSFNEFLSVLKSAKLHISGECGCVHMRHFLGQKISAVLFGPTVKNFYGYPENINISSGVCSGCEWMHNNWREVCLRSGNRAICLQRLQPSFVFEKIKDVL